MTIMAKPRLTAAYAAFIAAVALVTPATSQQPPASGSTPPQVAPAQPGPGMGQQMMQQGKEHGQAGQSMGAEMMQRGMEQGRMGMGPGMAGPGMMDGAMMPMMMGAGPKHTEGRLAFIKTELKITDPQMPQWNAFADAVRANATAMTDMRRAMAPQQKPGFTLPERLAMEDKILSAHFAAFKKIQESLTKLYDVLSADQKKIADGIVIGPMGMPMGMM
jgi:hypothetical protein